MTHADPHRHTQTHTDTDAHIKSQTHVTFNRVVLVGFILELHSTCGPEREIKTG